MYNKSMQQYKVFILSLVIGLFLTTPGVVAGAGKSHHIVKKAASDGQIHTFFIDTQEESKVIDKAVYDIKESTAIVRERLNLIPEAATSNELSLIVRSGWPKKNSGSYNSSPVFYDLDKDGKMEIISSNDGRNNSKIHIYKDDGKKYSSSWPRGYKKGYVFYSPLAVGDINNDDKADILAVAAAFNKKNKRDYLVAFDIDGSILWEADIGYASPYFSHSSPVIADIDGDKELEVVINSSYKGYKYPDDSYLLAFEGDGKKVRGYPKRLKAPSVSSPAVGDINNDGLNEIVCNDTYGKVYVYSGGSLLFSRYLGDANGEPSPVLVNLDNDDDLEIVVSGYVYKYGAGAIYALNIDGSIVEGWPAYTTAVGTGVIANLVYAPLGVGDIDKDGIPEILAVSLYDEISIWNVKGEKLKSRFLAEGDVVGTYDCGPSIADIDNDGKMEIVVSHYSVTVAEKTDSVNNRSMDNSISLSVLDAELSVLARVELKGEEFISYISFGDLDPDDKVSNLSFGGLSNQLLVLDCLLLDEKNLSLEWPTFQHDYRHSGQYVKQIEDSDIKTSE